MSKKQLIKNSALQLFSERGYTSVSADHIIERAGVSKGLLFFHFKSMKGLLKELLLDWLIPKWESTVENFNSELELWQCIEQMLDKLRANLQDNKAQYSLYFNIMLNEPNLLGEMQLDKIETYQRLSQLLLEVFADKGIKDVKEELVHFSTTLMGLEIQYCIQNSENGLKNFDISKEQILARYRSLTT